MYSQKKLMDIKLTPNQRVMGTDYNRHSYWVYVVDVDGQLTEIRGHNDERLRYKEVIEHFKRKGANKVWVKKEYKAYYRTFD